MASGATGADLTLSGNLTVNGTTTTVNSTTLTVDDKNIELGSVDTPTNDTTNGGGITITRIKNLSGFTLRDLTIGHWVVDFYMLRKV